MQTKGIVKKAFILLAAGFMLFSCSKKNDNKTGTNEANQQSQSLTTASTEYTKTDFYFKLPDKNGGEIDLKNYAGKPVMVMFFTENCPFCLKASGFIELINEKYNSKGLKVIGISLRNDKNSPLEFAQKTGVKFDLAYNGREVAKNYGISGVPFIYLLDKRHNLYKVWAGYDEEYNKSIEEAINKIL